MKTQTSIDPQAAHLAAWNLIPWLVNGSASAAQRAAFERHAASCEACRSEVFFQQQLAAAMHGSASPAHSAEPALARLQARIAIADSVDERASPAHLSAAAAWRQSGIWTRAWAGVALLQALGLVLLLSYGVGPRGEAAAEYRTLTSEPTAAVSTANIATLRLVPAPQMPAAQLPGLLQRHGLVAVEISADGSSLGVAWRDGSKPTAPVLAALRAEPLVLMAEPIIATRPAATNR